MPGSRAARPGPHAFRLAVSAGLLGWLLALPTLGRAAEGQDLYLEVFVNGRPMHLVTRFTQTGDGALSADAQELRNSGVLPDAAAARGEVRLDQIPGLGWRLIEPEQTIRFIVPDALLAPKVLDAGAETDPRLPPPDEAATAPAIDHGLGLVLNYGLNFESWQGAQGQRQTQASGSFDARVFMPMGALTHGFTIARDEAGDYRYRRLDSYWRSAFPGKAVQVQLGDIVTRGPGWSRPVRLGGVMVERNFAIRPDLVTLPLPGFQGSAALPSTVEVFAGSVRSYAADVPAGPFRIDDLPLTGGSGMARVVLRDTTGRETQVDLPFLVSDALLRRGMADFALAVGRPRLGIGTESDHYGPDSYGVATLRYGLNDSVTLLAHAEGGPDLAMAGLGATFRLAHLGTASLMLAESRAGGDAGRMADLSASLALGPAQLSGRFLRSSGRFTDVAAESAEPVASGPETSEFPRHLAQLSFSLPLQDGLGAGISLFASDIGYADGREDVSSLGASYSRQIWNDASLTLTAMTLRGQESDTVIGAQFHVPLGARHSVGALVERRNGGWRHYATAAGRSRDRVPGWDWRLQAERAGHGRLRASAGYQARLGRVEIAGRLGEGDRALGLRLDGAVVLAGGGLFLSRAVHDAFAVVDAGAPGVEVSAENRPMGRTGRNGKLLVPDLRAYEANSISIDPAGLPLDAAMGATKQTVRPAHHAGARVDFAVAASAREALVQLLDPAGQPLEVGGSVTLNGQPGDLLVGFDGETFMVGLADSNRIEVAYPDGRRCRAEFGYTDQPGTLTEIRGVPCL